MNKIKEMYNNGKAKLCGLHAAAYLAMTGTANASSDNSYASNCIDKIAETAKDAIEFVQSDAVSLPAGLTVASSLFLLSIGGGMAAGIAEGEDGYTCGNLIAGTVMMAGMYGASIAVNHAAYGGSAGINTAIGEGIVLGIGACYGAIRGRC